MKGLSATFEILRSLIDFIYPPTCPACGGFFLDDGLLCSPCTESLTEKAFSFSTPHRVLPNIDSITILFPYDTQCRNIIHGLKYKGMPSIGIFLGKLLGNKVLQNMAPDGTPIIIPVPIHPSKFKERGYNQSELLAVGFASTTGYPIGEHFIERIKKTETQTALEFERRILNVKNAFRYSAKTSLDGRSIILIDDVLTTGSTITECARVLKEGGAGKIFLCVAATPDIGNE
jgi:competence protein ComFC